MGMYDCRYFDTCSAPLCPKDDGAAHCVWFPDEDICRCADAPEWVKRQRKMSRKAAAGFCFTFAMLAHDCRISKNMKGIDPDGSDHEREAAIKTWLAAHPLITEAEREKYRATAGKLNDKSLGFQGANSVNPCVENARVETKGKKIPFAGRGTKTRRKTDF